MSSPSFVATRAASAASSCFQVVSYESRKSQRKNAPHSTKTEENDIDEVKRNDRKGIDIKRARREIIKFGMSGLSTQKKQEAKVALAISLGAKPPKNKNKNYKLILMEKKKEKMHTEEEKNLQSAGKNPLGVSVAKKKFDFNKNKTNEKKIKSDILNQYGKVNVKKDGVNATIKKNNFIKKRR